MIFFKQLALLTQMSTTHTSKLNHFHLCVIGGGASGFFSALEHKQQFPKNKVIILESSKTVLSKVKLSGGGRCNVTHACFDNKQLPFHYPRGQKELMGPFEQFNCNHTVEWFKKKGITLKTEADGRMFPISNSSQSIVDCLTQTAQKLGVLVLTQCKVMQLSKKQWFEIKLDSNQLLRSQNIILATGSSRNGYQLAQSLGHRIISPIPSLFSFKIKDPKLCSLQGISVKYAKVWLNSQKKSCQTGPVLITHWGLSGPAIIKLSAWQAKTLHQLNYNCSININWLANYTEQEVTLKLTYHMQQNPKKYIENSCPFPELASRFWSYILQTAQLKPKTTAKQISKKQLQAIITLLSQQELKITGKGVFKDEFVTCGGVCLKEINFKSMQSKLCKGLYIVGELLNIDGITGGFNFQNAWTTGYIAGHLSTEQ